MLLYKLCYYKVVFKNIDRYIDKIYNNLYKKYIC